jgi:phage FluMu protein gp41
VATATETLRDGLTVGETTHREAELREATAADLIDATAEAERLVQTPSRDGQSGEWVIVPSQTMLGLHVLRRQVLRIGTHAGQLTLAELRKLSAYDLNALQAAALRLEAASRGGARAGEPSSAGAAGTA